MNKHHCDVFLSHADKDKLKFVDALKQSFDALGIDVFYDKDSLTWGDNWKDVIEHGLNCCDFAVIVISKNFFGREWTEKELKALLSRQRKSGNKIVLPVLYNVSRDDMVSRYKQLGSIQYIPSDGSNVKDITIQLAKVLLSEKRGSSDTESVNAHLKEFFSQKSLDFFKWVEGLIAADNTFCDDYNEDIIGWYKFDIDGMQLFQVRDEKYRVNPKLYGAFKSYFDREIRPQM